MPIVFVHGVSTRKDKAYSSVEAARNGWLREIVAPALHLDPDEVTLLNPYWGDEGVRFAWNLASLPDVSDANELESFGGPLADEALNQTRILAADSRLADPVFKGDILEVAQKDLPAAVDLLFASAMSDLKTEEESRQLARSFLAANIYAQANPHPDWLAKASRTNFADQLIAASETPGLESFGAGAFFEKIKEAWSRLFTVGGDLLSGSAVRLHRQGLNQRVTRFAGDAFVYLANRGSKQSPGPIVQIVLDDLRKARTACENKDDKLIVIAHSFGGEIMYDILTHFDPELQVDCLITVGSQVGLFEEMKLFKASQADVPPNPPQERVPKPTSLKRWLNVYDTNDVLSYLLEHVFGEVNDFHYDTGYSFISAHGGYFLRPSFYARLADRLQKKDPDR